MRTQVATFLAIKSKLVSRVEVGIERERGSRASFRLNYRKKERKKESGKQTVAQKEELK